MDKRIEARDILSLERKIANEAQSNFEKVESAIMGRAGEKILIANDFDEMTLSEGMSSFAEMYMGFLNSDILISESVTGGDCRPESKDASQIFIPTKGYFKNSHSAYSEPGWWWKFVEGNLPLDSNDLQYQVGPIVFSPVPDFSIDGTRIYIGKDVDAFLRAFDGVLENSTGMNSKETLELLAILPFESAKNEMEKELLKIDSVSVGKPQYPEGKRNVFYKGAGLVGTIEGEGSLITPTPEAYLRFDEFKRTVAELGI